MSNYSDNFRNEVISKLYNTLPPDQLHNAMSAIDSVLSGYDVSKKTYSIISTEPIPDVVKLFLASKAVENLSKGTLKIYKLRLVDFFCSVKKPFQEITANDIRLYLYYYKETKNASDSYLDVIRRNLNSFFTWLIKNDYLQRNPCIKVEKIKYQEKERIPLTNYELETLRWNCQNVREKAFVDFFFSTGVRLSEFCAMNKSDVNWNNRSVIVRHGKGNKARTVFFNAEAELTLRKYIESRTDNNEALFVNTRRPYGRVAAKSVENTIKKIASRTDMHVYPHLLRHTFATCGLHGGMSLETLQALMGHSEPKTTMIYAKINTQDLQREHCRIYN